MSSLETRKIEPATGTTVTLGAGGDTVLVSASQLKTNTVKDAGGNTLFTSDGAGTISSVNSALEGSMVFISSQTATAATSIEFTTQLTSAYNEYVFFFVKINPGTDGKGFQFQVNASGQTGYNESMTTTMFRSQHAEADNESGLYYSNGQDQGNGTAFQFITSPAIGSASKECADGELHFFTPSSTTYIKQFYSVANSYDNDPQTEQHFTAGFINTTSAITEIKFQVNSGTFDGTIYLYGIK